MAKHTLEVKLFRGDNNVLDLDTSLAAFADTLKRLRSAEEQDLTVISAAVAQFWEKNPSLRSIQSEALGTIVVMQYLKDVDPKSVVDVKNRVLDYIRESKDLFYVQKGRATDGGLSGCCLIDRMTPAEIEHMNKARAKAAKNETATAG